MLKALEMSPELHHRLIERCAQTGVEFMSTPFDEEAADFLVAGGMKRAVFPERLLFCGGPVLIQTAAALKRARIDALARQA